MRDKIREFLINDLGVREDLSDGDALFSSGELDSLNSLQVLMFMQNEHGLKISPLDITIDDIDSVEKIEASIKRLG